MGAAASCTTQRVGDAEMNSFQTNQHLSRIDTLWSLVQQAHQADGSQLNQAQTTLLQRYSSAIYRYLLASVRDEDTADELFQEFSLRFVRGDFHRADPQRGRFRDFVKTALFHLIVDYQRRRKKGMIGLPSGLPEPAAVSSAESEQHFIASWRDGLLDRAWQRLDQWQRQSGQPYHTLLRLRAEQPTLNSEQLASELSHRLGRPMTAAATRQSLHRARARFADFLLEEVSNSLHQPTLDELEQELIDTGLHAYCRSALSRRRKS